VYCVAEIAEVQNGAGVEAGAGAGAGAGRTKSVQYEQRQIMLGTTQTRDKIFGVVDATGSKPTFYFLADALLANKCRDNIARMRVSALARHRHSHAEAMKRISVRVIELDAYSEYREYDSVLNVASDCSQPTEWSIVRGILRPASSAVGPSRCVECGACAHDNATASTAWRIRNPDLDYVESVAQFENSFEKDVVSADVAKPRVVDTAPDIIESPRGSIWVVVVDMFNQESAKKTVYMHPTAEAAWARARKTTDSIAAHLNLPDVERDAILGKLVRVIEMKLDDKPVYLQDL